MKRGTIYIQYGFWIAINKSGDGIFGPNVWDLSCLLRSSMVQAEFPIESFKDDSLLSLLWQESNGSCFAENGTIDTIIKREGNLSIENTCSVFLLDKVESECSRYAQQHGILCLNAKMLIEHDYLVSGGEKSKKTYDFHQKGSFYDLKESFVYPCNSLLIIDPHILNEKSYIKHHIKHLLSTFLPKTLGIPFHLSIYSGIGKINDAQLGESFYYEILQLLNEIRPQLHVSLSLFQIPIQGDGWHDRFIITNNMIIEASAGFDVFGPFEGEITAKKICHFYICSPLLNKNKDTQNYSIWIKKTANEAKYGKGYHHERWGTKENRLFELAED